MQIKKFCKLPEGSGKILVQTNYSGSAYLDSTWDVAGPRRPVALRHIQMLAECEVGITVCE